VNYAYGVDNVILLAPDYRYKPRIKYDFFSILSDLQDGYNSTFLQVVDNILLIEFLKQWDKSRNGKISIVGYSFGVPFAVATGRIQSVDNFAFIYGGSDLHFLIGHNFSLFNSFINSVFSNIFWLHVMHFEPERNLQYLSKVPTLIINGQDDEKIPYKSAQLLQNSINQPKEIVWLESKHVHPKNKKLSIKIISILRQWYKDNNFFLINN
jgi:dienelactone hydrolase